MSGQREIANLTAKKEGHYEYEIDRFLRSSSLGRNYSGKQVAGPYVRLLTFAPGEEIGPRRRMGR